MKYYAFTANPEQFVAGTYQSLILRQSANPIEDWVFVQEIEVDMDAIDMDMVRAAAVGQLDALMQQRRADFTAGMQQLAERKESLLALEHKPEIEE